MVAAWHGDEARGQTTGAAAATASASATAPLRTRCVPVGRGTRIDVLGSEVSKSTAFLHSRSAPGREPPRPGRQKLRATAAHAIPCAERRQPYTSPAGRSVAIVWVVGACAGEQCCLWCISTVRDL